MKVENGVLLKVENNDIIDGKFEFPNGVMSIGHHAFSGCSSLSKIDIPEGRTIDKGVVNTLKQIEDKVFRDRQKLLSECEDYKGLAETYNIAENEIQVHISREKDWYVIFKDNEEELYIADLGMVNGINAQGKGATKTDVIQQTLEIEESMYKLMLNAEEEQKPIRFEATEDTSYINIVKLAKRGLVHVEEDNKRDWSNCGDIQMHDMKIIVNKGKMQEELKKVQERLAKKREEALFRKVENKDAEGTEFFI